MSCQSGDPNKIQFLLIRSTENKLTTNFFFRNQSSILKDYMLHAIVQAASLRLIISYLNDFPTDFRSKHSLLLNIFVLMDMA
jgi:hypothetical protein